jgi:hypothetical protein
MKLSPRGIVCQCILALGVAAALVTPTFAQDGNIRSIMFYTVKPDRIGDFQAEVKEYNEVLKKGGSTRYNSVWLSLTGPRVYVRVNYYSKWADLDAGPDPKMKDVAADMARINVRIVDCLESWHRTIDEVQPDLSLPASGELPKMIRVLVTQVRADKYDAYLDLFKSDILPAAQKAGLKDYNFAKTRYGAPNTQVTSVAGMSAWADFDGGFGVEKALGKEGYQNLLNKVRPLIVESQADVYSFQPELSYLPPPAAK